VGCWRGLKRSIWRICSYSWAEFGGDLDQEFYDLVAPGLVFPQVAPTGQAQALVVLHPGGDDHFHRAVQGRDLDVGA